jgi:hypothetical protein
MGSDQIAECKLDIRQNHAREMFSAKVPLFDRITKKQIARLDSRCYKPHTQTERIPKFQDCYLPNSDCNEGFVRVAYKQYLK